MEKVFYLRSSPHLPVYRMLNTTIVLIRVAGRYGTGADEILEGSGIEPADLGDPLKLITTVQEAALIRRFLHLVRVPWIGLEVGLEYHYGSNGKLGLAMMCCDTFMDSLKLTLSYAHLTGSYHYIEVRIQGAGGQARFMPLIDMSDNPRCLIEAELVSTQIMASLGYEGVRAFKEIRLAFPRPEYAARYEEIFHCPVKFDAPEHLGFFDARALNNPMKLANPLVCAAMAKECAQLSQRLKEQETLSARIRQELLLGCDEFPTLDELARRISISPRTVRRRLREEDTSFMDILNDIRKRKAHELLSTVNLPIETVAERLGFNDVSSFYRAFKSWEGCTPGSFRERSARA